jgi:hypothetical protein
MRKISRSGITERTQWLKTRALLVYMCSGKNSFPALYTARKLFQITYFKIPLIDEKNKELVYPSTSTLSNRVNVVETRRIRGFSVRCSFKCVPCSGDTKRKCHLILRWRSFISKQGLLLFTKHGGYPGGPNIEQDVQAHNTVRPVSKTEPSFLSWRFRLIWPRSSVLPFSRRRHRC